MFYFSQLAFKSCSLKFLFLQKCLTLFSVAVQLNRGYRRTWAPSDGAGSRWLAGCTCPPLGSVALAVCCSCRWTGGWTGTPVPRLWMLQGAARPRPQPGRALGPAGRGSRGRWRCPVGNLSVLSVSAALRRDVEDVSREQAESRRRCDRERCALLAQVGALEAELQEQLSRQQEAAGQASELCALRQQVESLDKHLRSQRQFMDVSVPVRVDGLGALPCSWAGTRRSWRRRSRLSPVATARIPTPGLSSRARHLPSGGRPACHRKGRPPRPAALPQRPAGAVSTQRTRVSCGSSGPAWEGERAAASGPVPLLYPSRPSRVPFRGRGRDQGAMSPRATRTVCVS